MTTRKNEKKKLNVGKLVGLILVLALAETEFFFALLGVAFVLAPFALVAWLVYRSSRLKSGSPSREKISYQKQSAYDECPRGIFCFHKDKGEHHVRRGREMDPWDRPDIDISKYQRNH